MIVSRKLILFAALNGAMAVAVGAFAAHGAGAADQDTADHRRPVSADPCGYGRRRRSVAGGRDDWRPWPAGLASVGGLIFCLSLLLIAFLGVPAFGAVAPVGGVLMIAGWLCLAIAALRS